MIVNQVTPMSSFVPERHYVLTDKVLSCYKVEHFKHTADGTKLFLASAPSWQIKIPSKEAARQLMEDLYYGEYTGS